MDQYNNPLPDVNVSSFTTNKTGIGPDGLEEVLLTVKLQNWSKQNTITYQPDTNFYKKDLTVKICAEGKASLNIVANKQLDVQVDNVSFNNQYQVQKSNRYKFNEITEKYSIKSACIEENYGDGKLKTHLTFGDKSATNEIKFYWEGLNRSPHKPSI